MVMGDITRIDTVQQYCDLFEVEALHPLVSVVNCYEVQPIRHSKKLYNIYAVLLKDTDCGTMNYGRSLYDNEKGSMLFIAPGQVMGSDDDGSLHQPAGWGPDVPSRTIARYFPCTYNKRVFLFLI